jgi:superfamily II DNA or RNA helicase/SAM-dependent methyltransferase/SOS-response transcriptional repressor LexA
MTDTIAYYERHASRYVRTTIDVDMSDLHARFLKHIPDGGLILDAGCGSGRDSKAFLNAGYRIHAFDASAQVARLATEYLGLPVKVQSFTEFSDQACYDGIWACASLLHLAEAELPAVLGRLWAGLKPAGVLFVSFKHGEGERTVGERRFVDATEERLKGWLTGLPNIESMECWLSDGRLDRTESWLNGIIRRGTATCVRVIAGGRQHPFLPQLRAAISRADEIDFAVSFVKASGLRLLLPDLKTALGHGEARARPPARLRVITSDYLDITDPEALRLLILLQEQGALVRIFQVTGAASFHMKAYLFARSSENGSHHGAAFIGSSNISQQALTDGLEWNYRIDYPPDEGFIEARARFEELFRDPRVAALDDEWVEQYEKRRVPPPRVVEPGSAETEPPPTPSPIQAEALAALAASRGEGYRRGLVVMATGLGKTWLAAFDAEQAGARKILFVAHREEILNQAAETFIRIRPRARVGFYMGEVRDTQIDILCASIQTLSRNTHLDRFSPHHFDYIVIDEFHHVAAPTYRRLLGHFQPGFLLGLTATPDRTDQSDILSLCDENLVFNRNLFAGIEAGLLSPFHYYGIWDESVDYREIPWRNGRFDPEELSNKLATLARARHALKKWREHAQHRTLAFCVSIRHAEYMAEQFVREGVAAAAVYGGSAMSRGQALEGLSAGRLQVVFSVDLFSEGVDLPSIDTIMMLRPTESKVLFLQQLGRGLRKAPEKEKLVAIDFIGNHHSFLHKPQALALAGSSYTELANFARKLETGRIELPTGCFINYDLALIDFLKSLDSDGIAKEYGALKEGLGRRPTIAEFYRSGASIQSMRLEYGSWFELVRDQNDLGENEPAVLVEHREFLRELETTAMTKCFKMVLLEAFDELDGWSQSPSLNDLAERSWVVLQRRRPLLGDLDEPIATLTDGSGARWRNYWRKNPVDAWTGANQTAAARKFFRLVNEKFEPNFVVRSEHRDRFASMVQELVDFRLASYEVRQGTAPAPGTVVPFKRPDRTELSYFPTLKIACGHFRTARHDAVEHRSLGSNYGRLDPARHFIARASGNSMEGGKNPIREGDYLLLELRSPSAAGSITGVTMAIERQDVTGDDQYLLRKVTKNRDGGYVLVANNPEYETIVVPRDSAPELRTLAQLKTVIDPLDLALGQSFMREEIPALFGETFNPGNWNGGHVVLADENTHVLLVTLNKQGKAEEHRYLDHWINDHTFHWQSQNATTPHSKRGREIIEHEKRGISLHLFVRDAKLSGGKAAPFTYHGRARYRSHTGSAPMSVLFELIP